MIFINEKVNTYCQQQRGHNGECDKLPDSFIPGANYAKPKPVLEKSETLTLNEERCPHGFANKGNCIQCRNVQ